MPEPAPLQIWDFVIKYQLAGAMAVFIFGLWRGWWVMAAHAQLLRDELDEWKEVAKLNGRAAEGTIDVAKRSKR